MRRARPRLVEPLGLGLLLMGLFVALGLAGDWRARLGGFQVLWLAAFAAYGVSVACRVRWRALPGAGALVLGVGLLARAAVLPVTPTQSDDVWRYLWEGRVLAGGEDPYRHAPADPSLGRFRDDLVHPRVNHAELRTIYPPLAEAGFALMARLRPTLLAWKTWVLLHDLTLCALLAAWCSRRGGSAWDAAVYAWNPLVVVEYAGNGHHDPTGIVWMVLALMLAEARTARPRSSAMAAVAAVSVKLAALPAVAFLWRGWTPRVRLLAGTLLALLLGSYVVLSLGPGSGLAAFAERWRHNDALFGWLEYAFGPHGARIALAGLLLVVIGAALRERLAAADGTRLALQAGVLLGPVVHPWYLGWLLALEPLRPSAPWLLLSCTVTLGYGAFASPPEGGAYHPGVGWRALEYGLPALLAAGLALRRGGTGGRGRVREAA